MGVLGQAAARTGKEGMDSGGAASHACQLEEGAAADAIVASQTLVKTAIRGIVRASLFWRALVIH